MRSGLQLIPYYLLSVIIFIIYQPVVGDELCINQNVKKWGKYSHREVKTQRFGTQHSLKSDEINVVRCEYIVKLR